MYLIGLIAALASCDGNGLEVNDRSFRFSAEIALDTGECSYFLNLALLSGPKDSDYTLEYTIDGSSVPVLTDEQGADARSGLSFRLDGGSTVRFRLPVLELGMHSMHLSVSGIDYIWEEDLEFELSRAPLSVNAEVNTNRENPNSILLISLNEGIQDKVYDMEVDIDDEPVVLEEDEKKVNFSKKPILTVTLPAIRPGEHSICIRISDGTNSSESEISFDEPVRFPYLDLVVSHDSKTGNHILTVSRNPYRVHISVSSSLVLDGSCTYWLGGSGWDSYPLASEYQRTKSITVTDSRTVGTDSSGEFILASRDSRLGELTSQYEMSAVWGEVCNSEDCYWVVSLYEPHYYKLVSESFSLVGEIESVPGITARISSSIDGATWNGKALSTTPVTVKL